MSVSMIDAHRLDVLPWALGSVLHRLDLSVVDATITLPTGGYVLSLEDTSTAAGAILRLGAVASNPLSGASIGDSVLLPSGAQITMALEVQRVLHGIMRAGTGVLYAMRVE